MLFGLEFFSQGPIDNRTKQSRDNQNFIDHWASHEWLLRYLSENYVNYRPDKGENMVSTTRRIVDDQFLSCVKISKRNYFWNVKKWSRYEQESEVLRRMKVAVRKIHSTCLSFQTAQHKIFVRIDLWNSNHFSHKKQCKVEFCKINFVDLGINSSKQYE